MRKIIVLLVLGICSASSSFAGTVSNLTEEISAKVKIDLSKVTLDEYQKDFVRVQFKIYDGLIQIMKIEASQRLLKELIVDKLNEIHIRTPYSETEIHNYNFVFEKK